MVSASDEETVQPDVKMKDCQLTNNRWWI